MSEHDSFQGGKPEDRIFLHERESEVEPRNKHPLFETALKYQLSLDLQSYDEEVDLADMSREGEGLVRSLDIMAREAGLLGREVYISKNNDDCQLFAPSISFSDEEQAFLVSAANSDLDELRGRFHGFTIDYKDNLEEGESNTTALLCYMVQIGSTNLPYLHGSLCAFGRIDHTNIDFIEDRERQKAKIAVERMLKSSDQNTAVVIDDMNRLLGSEDKYNPFALSLIGEESNRLLNDPRYQDDPEFQDALIDLVSVRLDLEGKPARMKATHVVEQLEGQDFYVQSSLQSDVKDVVTEGKIQDIVYFPRYGAAYKSDKVSLDLNSAALYFAVSVDEDSNIVFVPMEFIKSFEA